jgi:hypothetical protein
MAGAAARPLGVELLPTRLDYRRREAIGSMAASPDEQEGALVQPCEVLASIDREEAARMPLDASVQAQMVRAKPPKFAMKRSMSDSSCWTEMSHCSDLPHGGRKTPPLCWKSQWAWLYRSSTSRYPR